MKEKYRQEEFWGLLGAEKLSMSRRMRSLGLGKLVRYYNEKAVPGMGGVWYLKQIYLSLFGVALARKAADGKFRAKSIPTANALEALACWLSFEYNNWKGDRRLKGVNKLRGLQDLSYRNLSKKNVYVTQPFRMRTVSVLPSLGLVDFQSTLFNSFELSSTGESFLDFLNEDYLINRRPVFEYLLDWIHSKESLTGETARENLRKCLSPLEHFSARNRNAFKKVIRDKGPVVDFEKRRRIFDLLDAHSGQDRSFDWRKLFRHLGSEHAREIHEGAAFFKLRSLVIEMLENLELKISSSTSDNVLSVQSASRFCKQEIANIMEAAHEYEGECSCSLEEARLFLAEVKQSSDLVACMVRRDGKGLLLQGDRIIPGPAFKGGTRMTGVSLDDDDEEHVQNRRGLFPEFVSTRLFNMYYLNKDFHGKLDKWLESHR